MLWDDAWLAGHEEAPLEPDLRVVDAHHHLLDPPGGPYLLEQLRADVGARRVVATVVVEAGFRYRTDGPAHLRPVGETEAVAALAATHREDGHGDGPAIRGIVGLADLTLGDAVEEVLAAHLEAGGALVKGIRHVTAHDPDPEVRVSHTRPRPGLLGQPGFRAGVRRLAALGMSFDAWLYHPQLPELVALARAVPEATIVLDHLGGPLGQGRYAADPDGVRAAWARDLAELATCPNVALKVGGIGMPVVARGPRPEAPLGSEALAALWRPWVEHALDVFGADRCMAESNSPVDKQTSTYAVLWNALVRMADGCSPAERAQLFAGTAERVYRL